MNKAVKKTDADKPWNRRKAGHRPYATESRNVEKTFLILCEGENTEPEYFKAFPVVTADVETLGVGRSRASLVRYAIEMREQEDNIGREVWCVFDYDDKPDNASIATDFQQALELASQHNIKLAWSNDAIELWFVLHHRYMDNALTRQQYYEMLTHLWELERSYESMGKQKLFCSSLYQRLLPLQPEAIRNARRLYKMQADVYPMSQRNPLTMVFELVEELNRYLRK